MKNISLIVVLMITFLLSGCTNKVAVILLPQVDGTVGKVFVSEDDKTTVLNQAWQKVNTKNNGKTEILSKEQVESQYEILLEGMPEELETHLFYFQLGSSNMTNVSTNMLKQITQDIKSKTFLQIDVIGYSDRSGKESNNKVLSLKRAKKVAEYLKKEGINSDIIKVDYYGETNLIVPTADGVANKYNRRVELTIK